VVNEANIGNLIDVIKYPLVTEKSTKLNENNCYSFIVDKKSNKTTIKLAIEYLFNVKVVQVNTINLPLKKRRVGRFIGYKPSYKKTIVKLAPDNKIDFFANS
jgi:large subunit ribosomal protein L23